MGKVEYGQLAPNEALGYLHTQDLFSLFLSTTTSQCDYSPQVLDEMFFWAFHRTLGG